MSNKSIKQLQNHIRKYFYNYKDIDDVSEYVARDIAEFYRRQTCSSCKHFKYDKTIWKTSSGSKEQDVYKCLLKGDGLRIVADLGLKCDEWEAKDE